MSEFDPSEEKAPQSSSTPPVKTLRLGDVVDCCQNISVCRKNGDGYLILSKY